MILVTNDIRYICAIRYYFGSNGVKCSSAGLYLTTPGQLIYAQSNGHVTKIILGELLEYKTSEGKITSCRVKEAQYMCYYNGEGILERKIDLNGKMVALTYDDGPSQYGREGRGGPGGYEEDQRGSYRPVQGFCGAA